MREQLDRDKRQAKSVLEELTRSGCAKAGQLGGYVSTETGLEFLQILDLGEFADGAAVLESEERLRRVCGAAAASAAMAGMSGGD